MYGKEKKLRVRQRERERKSDREDVDEIENNVRIRESEQSESDRESKRVCSIERERLHERVTNPQRRAKKGPALLFLFMLQYFHSDS